jgi:chromosome segregation ATPase
LEETNSLKNQLQNSFQRENIMKEKQNSIQSKVNFLSKQITFSISLGLNSFQGMKVFEPLYELFSCNHAFNAAVESVTGNHLFDVIFDIQKTVSLLIHQLNQKPRGTVTFLPLDSIQTRKSIERPIVFFTQF